MKNGIELNDCILSSIIYSWLYAHSVCFSRAVMYFGKGGSVEGLCVETAVGDGICQIFPLSLQRVFYWCAGRQRS